MFYKGILLDLDNTIYSYDDCHRISLSEIYSFISSRYNHETSKIKNIYETISNNIKYELNNTASSHNKSIYFKQLLETLKIDLSILEEINQLYWKTFFKNMVCFNGVNEFIIWNKEIGIKIGILTDYECEYQIEKLKQLDMIQYIDVIVTSEEVGIEKPSSQMFQTILRKINLNAEEVVMIGDNFKKDILGALNMGIFSYWFNPSYLLIEKGRNNFKEFNHFSELHISFKEFYNEITKMVKLSKFCGERFDLVQAGGGNSSVKIKDWMCIKASGVNMGNMNKSSGYVIIDNKIILEDIHLEKTKDVTEYNVIGTKRASIETYMHSILKKYTLHIHPIQINRILISKEAKNIINDFFPEALIIDYVTPGIKLCNEIKNKYNDENIIFLINHGIIITSYYYDEIYQLLETVITFFENKQQMNFEKYKFTNNISSFINMNFSVENLSYLCENEKIMNYFEQKKYLFHEKWSFPDALIYCGIHVLFLKEFQDIQLFYEKYNDLPKIIVIENSIYINAISLQKCREIEEVFLSNLMIIDSDFEKNYLSIQEIYYLNNWDSEKYRKNI